MAIQWPWEGPDTSITNWLAIVIVAALLGLFALRHFFGNISASAGVK